MSYIAFQGQSAGGRTEVVRNFREFSEWSEKHSARLQERLNVEARLLRGREAFGLTGHCVVCERETVFFVDMEYGFTDHSGAMIPNWRERLECWYCRLNCRMRAAIHFLREEGGAKSDARIYLSEQKTPMFAAIQRLFKEVSGSEYFGPDVVPGSIHNGLRHEDITRLTFPDRAFDFILSFDVLEHVPDYRKALSEMARCLKLGGKLLLTAPFDLASPETIVRAVLENGQIRHLLPPEYHGDPVTGSVLCFYHFGWDLMDDLRAAGFSECGMHFYWSLAEGYLGGGAQFIVLATR